MAKFKNNRELFDYFIKQDPFSVFQTEFGFLKLSDQQKGLIQKMSFTTGKHIFAYIAEDSDGIKCIEVSAEHPDTFSKIVDKHEKKSLAFTYLGVSDGAGRVVFEQS